MPELNPQTRSSSFLATTGPAHAWWQRTTAVILIPLVLWLAFGFGNHVLSPHGEAIEWLTQPAITILFALTFVVLVLHAHLGITVVSGDYATNHQSKQVVRISGIVSVMVIVVTVGAVISLF